MARAYYSMVLDHSADEVWAVIRPFDHYGWAGIESETTIESSEWSATFDCASEERERWLDHFEQQGFATWLAALRRLMDTSSAAA